MTKGDDDEVNPRIEGAMRLAPSAHSDSSARRDDPGAGPGVASSKMRNVNDASGSSPPGFVRIPGPIVHVTVSPSTNPSSGWNTIVFPSSERRTDPSCEPDVDPTAWTIPGVSDERSTNPPGRTMIVVPGK